MKPSFWELGRVADTQLSPLPILSTFGEAWNRLDPLLARVFKHSRVRVGFGRSHLLELVVFVQGPVHDSNTFQTFVEDLLALQLGLEVLDHWIGQISVVSTPRSGPLRVIQPAMSSEGVLALDELAGTIVDVIHGLQRGLPELPCYARCDEEPWLFFELEPELSRGSAQASNTAQSDLVTATTWMPEMLRCLLSGDPFYSGRFSRHGEQFCYLEIVESALSERERLARRQRLEDSLNGLLSSRRLGCVVGNGIGLAHSYIDLALLDPIHSLIVIRSLVRSELRDPCWLYAADTEHMNQRLALQRD